MSIRPRVLVLYYSSYGHVEAMAQAVRDGANEAGALTELKRVPELVPPAVAERAGYRLDQPAPVARIESIKVGDAEVSGMMVSIHDAARFPQFEGLLGMDFLGRFQISVDWDKQLLVLTRK